MPKYMLFFLLFVCSLDFLECNQNRRVERNCTYEDFGIAEFKDEDFTSNNEDSNPTMVRVEPGWTPKLDSWIQIKMPNNDQLIYGIKIKSDKINTFEISYSKDCQTFGNFATHKTPYKHNKKFSILVNTSSARQNEALYKAVRECLTSAERERGKREGFCQVKWDGIMCWNSTKPGTVASAPCPDYINGLYRHRYASKVCNEDGTWWRNPVNNNREWTNYTECYEPYEPLKKRRSITASRERHENTEMKCLKMIRENPNPRTGDYCEARWDGWGCWNRTEAGTTAYISCPGYIDGFNTQSKASKVCRDDGTWFKHPVSGREWSNYTTCVDLRVKTSATIRKRSDPVLVSSRFIFHHPINATCLRVKPLSFIKGARMVLDLIGCR